ncbi:MAG TPA: tripartite tricarboxylate transporter substrate binding protein [Burkholderiales bacterium]|nr:tripartite tricarboxylate transporter substrate binding protein [Burkholderiales bacterium]
MKGLLTAFIGIALFNAAAVSAAYPDRPVRFIVSSGAGGAPDFNARTLAAELSKQMGQQFVVDNRPGAGSTLGTTMMAKAAPDGYTIGYGTIGPIAIQRSLQRNLPYDADKDLRAVVLVTLTPNMLAVTQSLQATSVKELIDHARANPGKLFFASTGTGASQHLTGELFKFMTAIQIDHVPFKQATPALADLTAGRVHLMFENINSIAPHVKSGRLRGLGVTTSKRVAAFPDMATIAETVPGFESVSWGGIVVPAGVPNAIVVRLNQEVNSALLLPHVRERFAAFGVELSGGPPEVFTTQIRKDAAKWADVIRRAGIKPD